MHHQHPHVHLQIPEGFRLLGDARLKAIDPGLLRGCTRFCFEGGVKEDDDRYSEADRAEGEPDPSRALPVNRAINNAAVAGSLHLSSHGTPHLPRTSRGSGSFLLSFRAGGQPRSTSFPEAPTARGTAPESAHERLHNPRARRSGMWQRAKIDGASVSCPLDFDPNTMAYC